MFRTVPLSIIRSFVTVHTAIVYVIQVCWQLSANLYDIYNCWKCSKHLEFYSKNKFEKIVHLVRFLIRSRSSANYFVQKKIPRCLLRTGAPHAATGLLSLRVKARIVSVTKQERRQVKRLSAQSESPSLEPSSFYLKIRAYYIASRDIHTPSPYQICEVHS